MNNKEHRRLEISLKMVSKVGISIFTLLGVAAYLFAFFGIAFTTTKPMQTGELLFYGIGGALLVGVFIIVMLCFFRYFIRKAFQDFQT